MVETSIEEAKPVWRGVLRETFTVETCIALVIGVVVTVVGVHLAARSPESSGVLGVMGMGPIVATALAVAQLVRRGNQFLVAQFFLLTVVVSFVSATACTIAAYVTIAWPGLDILRDAQGANYYLDAPPVMFVGVVGVILAFLTGIAVFVVIVLPVVAISRPRQFTEANMLDQDPKYAARNRRAGIAMSFMLSALLLGFVLIIVASGEATANSVFEAAANLARFAQAPDRYVWDLLWVIGALLVAVGGVLVLYVAVTQRTDLKRRRDSGTRSLIDRIQGSERSDG